MGAVVARSTGLVVAAAVVARSTDFGAAVVVVALVVVNRVLTAALALKTPASDCSAAGPWCGRFGHRWDTAGPI